MGWLLIFRAGFLLAGLGAWFVPTASAAQGAADTTARLDELLDAIDPPSARALLESLGEPPPLETLLAPIAEERVPLMRMPLPKGYVSMALERRELERQLLLKDPDGALALAEECVLELTELMGEGHPRVLDAAEELRRGERYAALELEDRRALLASQDMPREAARRFATGDREGALEQFVGLVELELALMGEGARLGISLGSLAAVLHATGDFARAERCARGGLRLTLDALGARNEYVARSLNDLALLLTAAGHLIQAEGYHAHSLAVRRELFGDDGREFALALMHLADLFRFRNELERAAAVAERASMILRETGEAPERLGILLYQRGVLAWMAGEDERARELLEESVAVLEAAHGGDHIELAQALGALSDLEQALGEFESAHALAVESLGMHERVRSGPHPSKSQARARLGQTLAMLGELDGAERELRAALDEMERSGAGGRDLASGLETLASLLARKGEARGAELQSERALAELRRIYGRSRHVANALRRLSGRQLASGDLAAATATLGECAALFVELLGPQHARVAEVRVELAGLFAKGGELEQADSIVRAVLAELAAEPASSVERRARGDGAQLAAQIALERGELEDAESWCTRALTERRASYAAPHPELVESLSLTGAIQEARGALEPARDAYAAALEQADSLRTRILGDERDRALYAGVLSLGSIARALSRTQLALDDPRAAIEAAERGRERALLDLLERSSGDLVEAARARGDDSAGALAAQLAGEAAARRALLAAEQELLRLAAEPATDEARMRALEAAVREARRGLRRREAELEAGLREVWPSARPGSADAISAALNADEAMLHYGIDERGASLIVVRGGEPARWLGLRIARGAEALGALRAELSDFAGALRSGGALDAQRLQTLSDSLIPAQVWELTAGCRRLVIVPDGALHELPFEALVAPGGAWVEHGPRVVYSPSAALYAGGARTPERGVESTARAVVLGAPRFGEAREAAQPPASRASTSELDRARLFGARLQPLPGSGAEARGVAATLAAAGWEVGVLLDDDASVPSLRAAVSGARLVHLATHGLAADARRPYEAALALSAPETMSVEDDGFLTLDDLVRSWRGALDGCELVVLSACDTQVGVALGESRVALSWGFFFAGARGVLVSLWKVDDRATALLMDRFYGSLTGRFDEPRRAGGQSFEAGSALPPEAALQEAKAWLARSNPAQNRARLVELGLEHGEWGPRGGATQGQFPAPGAAPSSSPTAAAYDFRAPRFGAAFVLYGRAD